MISQFLRHAQDAYPNEACGLVVQTGRKQAVIRCRNISDTPDVSFAIHPEDYAAAEERGNIVAVYHSHPNGVPEPSVADLSMCEAHGLPWHIVSWPVVGHKYIEPSGYVTPLIGRPFVYGIHDCFSLVRDYHKTLGIDIPEFDHGKPGWWNTGENLYLDGLGIAGFQRVLRQPVKDDVLLMRFNGLVPHHAAIYLGDNQILHHLDDRLSGRVFYGQFYRDATTHIVRHTSLC